MSNSRWCDIGQHAFPEGQFGSTEFGVRQNVRNQWGGSQPTERMQEACAACANDSGIKKLTDMDQSEEDALAMAYHIRDGGVKPRSLANGETKADPELYQEFLEWKNGMRDEPK